MNRIALALGLIAGGAAFVAAADDSVARTAANGDSVRRQGLSHLRDWLGKRGMDEGDMEVDDTSSDSSGMVHLRARQRHRGVPVHGAECIVHMYPDGSLFKVTDSIVPAPDVDIHARINRREAIAIAKEHHGCLDCDARTAEVDVRVLRHDERDHLVYRVRLFHEDELHGATMPVSFVDASDGHVVASYDNLQTGTATGTGSSLYNGVVSLTTFQSGTTFNLEDVTRNLGTFDYRNGVSTATRCTDSDNSWTAADQRAAVEAHYDAAKTYDYYLTAHGRDGINGAGGPFSATAIDGVTPLFGSRVHYSTNYVNAFWNGQFMTYGDGNGSTFSPLVTLDITGHEMTHGVIEYTAGLVYTGETGALNESIADVFGAMVERFARGESPATWKFAEDAYTPSVPGDPFRSMENPHAAPNAGFTADDDPDHYTERYTGSSDNGGVHVNSGIPSKAFYLLANGGTHHLGGSMSGIGADAAAQIWYRALTTYLTSSANFAAARTATLNAASVLYGAGSAERAAVMKAWCLVGIGACEEIDFFGNGGLEGTLSPSAASGTGALYTVNGNAPHAGTGYMVFGNGSKASGQTFQQITIPSTASSAKLTFFLNVTSEEIGFTQFDKLFVEVLSTRGTLLTTLATFSNLDKAALGVYTGWGPYSLLPYKGQTVRLQFRVATDLSRITTFRVDDVSVK